MRIIEDDAETYTDLHRLYRLHGPLLLPHRRRARIHLRRHEPDQGTVHRRLNRSSVPQHSVPLTQMDPENWTKAMLALPLINQTDINYLNHWLKVMEGWKWNLIPMFLLGLVVASLSVVRCVQQRVMSNVYAK